MVVQPKDGPLEAISRDDARAARRGENGPLGLHGALVELRTACPEKVEIRGHLVELRVMRLELAAEGAVDEGIEEGVGFGLQQLIACASALVRENEL